MKREPITILAAIGVVATWALHTYIPTMPPEIVSAVGVLITAIARQWVVPAGGKHDSKSS